MPGQGIFFRKKLLYMELPSHSVIAKVQAELELLDQELVEVDGGYLRPSQCYRYDISPPHLLFNTNCPESLKQKINDILAKYLDPDESSTQ